MVSITISGESVVIYPASLNIHDAINTRSTCSFQVSDPTNNASYVKGMPVVVTDDGGAVIFSGFVDNSTSARSGNITTISVNCIDMHYLADKRVCAKSYTNKTAGYIVKDLVSTYLAAEGVVIPTLIDVDDHKVDWDVYYDADNITTADSGVTITTRTQPSYSHDDTLDADFNAGTHTNTAAVSDSLKIAERTGTYNAYTYYKTHVVNGNASASVTNYQTRIAVYKGNGSDSTSTVYLNGHSDSGTWPNDFRFSTDADAGTAIDFWIEYSDANYALVWIEIPSIAQNSTTTIRIYYGNSGASSGSSGTNTFPSFTHFDGGSTPSGWTLTTAGDPTVTYSDSKANIALNAADTVTLQGPNITSGQTVMMRFIMDTFTGGQPGWGGDSRFILYPSIEGGMACYDNPYGQSYYKYRMFLHEGVSWGSGLESLNTGQWYTYEVRQSGATIYGRRDFDASWGSYAVNSTSSNYQMLKVLTSGSYTTIDMHVDFILTRNFVDGEITHGSWGTEQNNNFYTTANWVSPTDSITGGSTADNSRIKWTGIDLGNVTVQVSTDGGSTYVTQPVNGGPILVSTGPDVYMADGWSTTDKSIKVKVSMTGDGMTTPFVTGVLTEVYADAPLSGYRTTRTDVSSLGTLGYDSAVSWTSTEPLGTDIKVYASLDNATWEEITTSGGCPPCITDDMDAAGEYLYIKTILYSDYGNVTPTLTSLTINPKTGVIHDGLTLEEASFNYVPLSRAFQALADRCGYWWCISPDRYIWFQPIAGIRSAWTSVEEGDGRKGTVKVISQNTDYRNKQIVKGGVQVTTIQQQELVTDSKTKSWALSYPVNSISSITLAGVEKTVGIKGQADAADFYYQKGDSVISAASVPATGNQLLVNYYGEFPMVTIARSDAEINTRKAVEGVGTGIVENVIKDDSFNNADSAKTYASNILNTYGYIGSHVKVNTKYAGLYAGEVVHVHLPSNGIDGDMLVYSVDVRMEGASPLYTVTLSDNRSDSPWVKLFSNLQSSNVIRENLSEKEVVVTTETFSESLTWTEPNTPTDATSTTYKVSNSTFPNTNIYPG